MGRRESKEMTSVEHPEKSGYPESVFVDNRFFKIIEVENKDMARRVNWAEIDYPNRVIRIDKTIPWRQERLDVLFHEVAHAFQRELGETDTWDDENINERLGKALWKLIANNRKLIDYVYWMLQFVREEGHKLPHIDKSNDYRRESKGTS